MFQIRPDRIRPHYKSVNPLSREEVKDGKKLYQIISVYSWEHDGINPNPDYKAVKVEPNLNTWFDVKIIVNGSSIKIYINKELVLDQPSSLKISSGKIGLRNSTNEEALVRNLSVKLI